MLKIKCDKCNNIYQFSEENIGKKAKCKCGNIIIIEEKIIKVIQNKITEKLSKALSVVIILMGLYLIFGLFVNNGLTEIRETIVGAIATIYFGIIIWKKSCIKNKQEFLVLSSLVLTLICISIGAVLFGYFNILFLIGYLIITLFFILRKGKDYGMSFIDLLKIKF